MNCKKENVRYIISLKKQVRWKSVYLPRKVRREIRQNAMKRGDSWHNDARGKGVTTGGY